MGYSHKTSGVHKGKVSDGGRGGGTPEKKGKSRNEGSLGSRRVARGEGHLGGSSLSNEMEGGIKETNPSKGT